MFLGSWFVRDLAVDAACQDDFAESTLLIEDVATPVVAVDPADLHGNGSIVCVVSR